MVPGIAAIVPLMGIMYTSNQTMSPALRAGLFVPVTSAWYPLLHNIYLYGGLSLFTLYIAYDTQKMIDEYGMGIDDHIKHATDLFIDFKIVFSRVLQLLMMS